VLFRNRGYTHEDKPFDVTRGERDFGKYAGYIFPPDVRPTSEIKFTRMLRPARVTFSWMASLSLKRVLYCGTERRGRQTDPGQLL
jgi:hypothetical protein